MSRPKGPPEGQTHAVVDGLFRRPPRSQDELERRLRSVDTEQARGLLVDRLGRGEVEDGDTNLLVASLAALGLGDQTDRLRWLASDPEHDQQVRFQAVRVLVEGGALDPDQLMEWFSPDDLAPLAEETLTELMAAIQADPGEADTVCLLLESAPPEMQILLMERIEESREQAGTSAAAAYRCVLGRGDLRLTWDLALGALVEEGGDAAIRLLESLRDGASDNDAHRAFQGALLRLRTRALDADPTPETMAEGVAHMGSCDGQGTFILIATLVNPDGTRTLADLLIRSSGEIRDGFVVPRSSEEEALRLIDECVDQEQMAFVEVPLSEATRVAREAVARTRRGGLTLPESALPAVELFQRVKSTWRGPQGDPREPPVRSTELRPPRGRGPTLTRVRELLSRPEYSAWFFDLGDLDGAGVELPARPSRVKVAWYRQAAGRLASRAVSRRVVAMAWHMMRYHRWRGELEEARLCFQLAMVTARNFAGSALVRVILERSLRSTGTRTVPRTVGDRV